MNFQVSNTAAKPRTLLIAAALIAAIALTAIAMTDPASARSGGGVTTASEPPAKYERLYKRIPAREKRWARTTSECESGGDPDAIGGGGIYRGAFQFLKSTWKVSPKSPGGDPVAYSYRTQAVVAVALKQRDGADHWPVCG